MDTIVHPVRYTTDGKALCRWCSKPTAHYTIFVCDERIQFRSCLASEREQHDREFLTACGIAVDATPTPVTVQMVICREVVQKYKKSRVGKPVARRRETPDRWDIGDISCS